MFEIFVQYFNLRKYIIQTYCFITPTTSNTLVLINKIQNNPIYKKLLLRFNGDSKIK